MPIKILVVDDEPDLETLILQKFRRKIRKQVFEFHFARNGLEALETVKSVKGIDMILTDINMPEMDGLTFLEELVKLPVIAKAVVVSAYGDMDNIRTAMNRGAFDFLTKPIDFSDLEATIEKTLSELNTLKQGLQARDALSAIQQEMELAGRLQQSILPNAYPDRTDVAVFGKMVPAKEVGGDFYDFFFVGKDRLGFIIADVSGKGVTAAMFMGVSRTLLRFTALQGLGADKVLTHVNNLLCVDNEICMFVTVLYGILDLNTGELTYANGGHTPPVRLREGSPVEVLPRTQGIALGIVDDSEFQAGRTTLAPGDLIYLCTDGMPDAENPANEFFGEERLMAELGRMTDISPEYVVNNAYNIVTDHVASGPQFDDMTQIAIQYQPPLNR